MRIGFYTFGCLPFHAGTLDERPLGGVETGVLRLADALTLRGHDVVVYTSHPGPYAPSRVSYRPLGEALNDAKLNVQIVVKEWRAFFNLRRGPLRLFLTGDPYYQYSTVGIGDPRVLAQFDGLLTVSEWHRETLCASSGFPLERAYVIGNGIHAPYFDTKPRPLRERSLRLLYTSAPNRGLHLVPVLYRALKQKLPQLLLDVYSGLSIYDTATPFAGPEVGPYHALCKQLSQLPGATIHGNVLQRDLAAALYDGALLFYPNTMPETSCICAMEAMAAGCPVLSSSEGGGLTETVGPGGVLIGGTPGSKDYLSQFAEAAGALLTNAELWERYSRDARRHALAHQTWECVAERFEDAVLRTRQGARRSEVREAEAIAP